VDRPGATTSTVHAVRAAEDVIVGPAIAVELFPLALPGINEVKYPAHQCLLGAFVRPRGLLLLPSVPLNLPIQPSGYVPVNQPPLYGPVLRPVVGVAIIGRRTPNFNRFRHLNPAISKRTTAPNPVRPASCHIAEAERTAKPS